MSDFNVKNQASSKALRLRSYLGKTYSGGQEAFYREMDEALAKGEKHFVVTANPEVLMAGAEDDAFDRILMDPRVTIVPDGIGVVKAASKLGLPIKERVTGVELSQHLIEEASDKGYSIYLLGAKEEVVSALVSKIGGAHPGARLAGYQNGYVEDKAAALLSSAKSSPDIILVALGVPAQEKLIYSCFEKFPKGIFVGVGGSFDVLSGSKKRAPAFFVDHNLEWLYRIFKEPGRLGRFARSNLRFVNLIRKIPR